VNVPLQFGRRQELNSAGNIKLTSCRRSSVPDQAGSFKGLALFDIEAESQKSLITRRKHLRAICVSTIALPQQEKK